MINRERQEVSSLTLQDQQRNWSLFLRELCPESNPAIVDLMQKLRFVSHSLYQRLEGQSAEINLSFAQYRILLHLHFCETMENRPSLNPSEISERHRVNRNTISSLISTLEKGGYIIRQLDEADRRKFNIGLTQLGREIVRDHFRCHAQTTSKLFETLTEAELNEFGRILDKLAIQLDTPTN